MLRMLIVSVRLHLNVVSRSGIPCLRKCSRTGLYIFSTVRRMDRFLHSLRGATALSRRMIAEVQASNCSCLSLVGAKVSCLTCLTSVLNVTL